MDSRTKAAAVLAVAFAAQAALHATTRSGFDFARVIAAAFLLPFAVLGASLLVGVPLRQALVAGVVGLLPLALLLRPRPAPPISPEFQKRIVLAMARSGFTPPGSTPESR